MTRRVRPSDNPFNMQRVDALEYIEHNAPLASVIDRLQANRWRGAIVGPHGYGKSAMLDALTPHLKTRALRPQPLFINSDQRGKLPKAWRRTVIQATPKDALLLDGYDLLPWWARGWMYAASRKAGAVIVTAHQRTRFKTIAEPKPTRELLRELVQRLAPETAGSINVDALFDEAKGNLRDALRLAYDLSEHEA